jgi:hypothetical protein
VKEAESSRWNFLRHPTERGEGHSRFDRAAEVASDLKLDALAAALLDRERGGGIGRDTHAELEDAVRLHEEI